MPSFVESVGTASRNFACRLLSNNAAATGYIAGLTSSVPGVGRFNNAVASSTGYLAGLACPGSPGGESGGGGGGDNFNGVPGLPPGQCPGVPYRIQGTAQLFNSNGSFNRNLGFLSNRNGPLPRFILEVTSNNILVVDEQGTTLSNLGNRPTGVSTAEWLNGYPSVSRQDGQPVESCDAGTPDDDRPRTTQPVTYNVDNGPDITNNIDIIADPPIMDIDNNLIVPFIYITPTFEANAYLDISTGDLNFNFGEPAPTGTDCCPPLEDVPPDDDETDEDPPPPDDDLRLVGLKVVSTITNPSANFTSFGNGTGPVIFFRRLCLVRFAIEVAGIKSWTAATEVQTQNEFVPVPATGVAYFWDVIEEHGVSVRTVPVYLSQTDLPSS